MLDEIYAQTTDAMEKSIESLKHNFTTLRSGAVNTAVLDGIQVESYGNLTPLSQLASVTSLDANTLSIAPWDKSLLKEIESAISAANLGATPNNNGNSIVLPFAPMSTDQREASAKEAKAMSDNAKVAIRNIRKTANDKAKKLFNDKEITEDEHKTATDRIQQITDKFIGICDSVLADKQKALLTI